MSESVNFEQIRSYNSGEVALAVERMANHDWLPMLVKLFAPEYDVNEYRERFRQLKTTEEFQDQVVMPVIDRIIHDTMSSFSYKGGGIDGKTPHILISNHRDIVLDSAILNIMFLKNGIDSSEIIFGDNLLKSDFIVDFCKVNKMSPILRGGNIRDFYRNTLEVSAYMRHVVTERKHSIWIAQRNGRTKDGNDKTEIGVLKMFSLSTDKPFVEAMDELKINPISVSYEYDPCDFMKASELHISTYQKYIKSKHEDLNSIMKGFLQYKGDVQFSVAEPITLDELKYCNTFDKNDKFVRLAEIIDERVYSNYKLFKTNYIAHDMLQDKTRFADRYTPEDKEKFEEYMNRGLEKLGILPNEDFVRIFLKIYAAPVDNCLKYQK